MRVHHVSVHTHMPHVKVRKVKVRAHTRHVKVKTPHVHGPSGLSMPHGTFGALGHDSPDEAVPMSFPDEEIPMDDESNMAEEDSVPFFSSAGRGRR